ncbi:MAG: hypothetical protein FWH37_09995, partial [Candidatus Bathyarchaeota archaeon]|nr:hypothetical protein [Candidatus Termiticorpusculum sp.]
SPSPLFKSLLKSFCRSSKYFVPIRAKARLMVLVTGDLFYGEEILHCLFVCFCEAFHFYVVVCVVYGGD